MKYNLIQVKKKAIPILRKSGVIRSAVFGSVARGTERKNSDIDFLVEFKKGKSLLDLIHLKYELEKVFRRKADVVTYNAIHPLLRESILNEQKIIYVRRKKKT